MNPCHADEEHELPCIEAMIAGTLALMTGYGQSLLADQPPGPRLAMATRIGEHLAVLADHPHLSGPFRRMLANLQRRWTGMSLCSAAETLPPEPERPIVAPAPAQLQ